MVVWGEWPVERQMNLQQPVTAHAATFHNRPSKANTSGWQFAPDTRARPSEPASRNINLSPGDGGTFPTWPDGDIIKALNVSRSDEGSGYWISPAQPVNIKDLITDADVTDMYGSHWNCGPENNRVIEGYRVERGRRRLQILSYSLDERQSFACAEDW